VLFSAGYGIEALAWGFIGTCSSCHADPGGAEAALAAETAGDRGAGARGCGRWRLARGRRVGATPTAGPTEVLRRRRPSPWRLALRNRRCAVSAAHRARHPSWESSTSTPSSTPSSPPW
jgi:hypothetical protein